MQSPDSKNIYYDVSIGLSSMVRLGTDDDLKKKYNITGDVSPFASLLIKEDGSDFQIGQSITNGAVNFVPLADDQLTPLLTLGTISINASADAEVANGPVYYLVRAVGQASTPPSNPSSQALRCVFDKICAVLLNASSSQYLLSQTSVFMKAYVLKGHARLLHWEILGATNEVVSFLLARVSHIHLCLGVERECDARRRTHARSSSRWIGDRVVGDPRDHVVGHLRFGVRRHSLSSRCRVLDCSLNDQRNENRLLNKLQFSPSSFHSSINHACVAVVVAYWRRRIQTTMQRPSGCWQQRTSVRTTSCRRQHRTR
jgi:hypothetical protein